MWFTANILFKSQCASLSEAQMLWEERFVIFAASEQVNAMEKALHYGKSEEHSYTNERKELVEWKFDGVISLHKLDTQDIHDKLEVFTRFLKFSEVASLKSSFEDRS
jgi:hypothetical protein